MTISMALATVIHLAVLAVPLSGLGWMLHHAWLRRFGLSWRVGTGLVLAALSVLFSNLASLFGYSLWLMLLAAGIVVLIVAVFWLVVGRQREGDSSPGEGISSAPAILFHLFVMGFFIAPAFVLYLPLDTDAQGFGYLALMIREGGTLNTLAPWQPDVGYLYSPAALVWWAFLSDLLKLPMHQVMLPFSHIAAGFVALLGIDLGEALMPGRPRARVLMPLMAVFGTGLLLRVMDSAYTAVLGLLFATLFLTLAFQAARIGNVRIDLLASLALAAVALSSPDAIVVLLMGYVPFYLTFWFSRSQHRTRAIWMRLFLLIPSVGVLFTLPWLIASLPLLLNQGLTAPIGAGFNPPYPGHWRQLVLFQGVLVPVLALGGIVIALRRRWLADLLMLTWLIFVLDFSLFGMVDAIAGLVGVDLLRFVFPHAVGWHGPITIYAYFATLAVDWLLDRYPVRWPRWPATALPAAGLGMLAIAVIFQRPLLRASYPHLSFYGSFASRADLAAMDYLRRNTSEDALMLNYPLGTEGHWVPVIAERQSVAFREQPFFSGGEAYHARLEALSVVYFDLARPDARALLAEYGVTCVVIPQALNSPAILGDMSAIIRWRAPDADKWYPLISSPADVDWLELVFGQDGAQVYCVSR